MAAKKKKMKKKPGGKKSKAKPKAKPKTRAKKKPVKKKTSAKKKPAAKKAAKKKAAKKKPSKKKATKKAAKKTARKTKPAKKSQARKKSASGKVNMATKTTKGLSKKVLDYFKKKLLAEKQRVLEEMGEMQKGNLKQSITDKAGEISRYSYHLGDTASLSYDREFSMGLAERQQKYLEQIDDALGRIQEGTYGICKVTGETIPRERLEEVPVAKYSVKGKELLEQRKRQGLA